MIKTNVAYVEDIKMQGFAVSTPSTLSVQVEGGTFSHKIQDVPHVTTVEAFAFDVEADADLPVHYCVYLTKEGLWLERTVFTLDNLPMYTGDSELLHYLLCVEVPAGATHIDEATITLYMLDFPVKEEAPIEEANTTQT